MGTFSPQATELMAAAADEELEKANKPIIDDDKKEDTSPPASANKKRTRKMFDDQCKQDTITKIPSPPNKKQKTSKETTPSTSAFADFFKERARKFTAKKPKLKVAKPITTNKKQIASTNKTTCVAKPKIEK